MPQKTKSLDQVEAMRRKAIKFLYDVVGDSEKAADFEAMTPQEYAERKHLQIENPSGRKGEAMPGRPTRTELEQRVEELEEEVSDLNERLDSISELAASDEQEGDEEDDD
jgi:hypothetical protein